RDPALPRQDEAALHGAGQRRAAVDAIRRAGATARTGGATRVDDAAGGHGEELRGGAVDRAAAAAAAGARGEPEAVAAVPEHPPGRGVVAVGRAAKADRQVPGEDHRVADARKGGRARDGDDLDLAVRVVGLEVADGHVGQGGRRGEAVLPATVRTALAELVALVVEDHDLPAGRGEDLGVAVAHHVGDHRLAERGGVAVEVLRLRLPQQGAVALEGVDVEGAARPRVV